MWRIMFFKTNSSKLSALSFSFSYCSYCTIFFRSFALSIFHIYSPQYHQESIRPKLSLSLSMSVSFSLSCVHAAVFASMANFHHMPIYAISIAVNSAYVFFVKVKTDQFCLSHYLRRTRGWESHIFPHEK